MAGACTPTPTFIGTVSTPFTTRVEQTFTVTEEEIVTVGDIGNRRRVWRWKRQDSSTAGESATATASDGGSSSSEAEASNPPSDTGSPPEASASPTNVDTPPPTTDPPTSTTDPPTTTPPPPPSLSTRTTTRIFVSEAEVISFNVGQQTLFGGCDGSSTTAPPPTGSNDPADPTNSADSAEGASGDGGDDGIATTVSGGQTVVVSQIVTASGSVVITIETPIATLSSNNNLSDSARAGIIAGATIGGILILVGLLACLFVWRRSKQKRSQTIADTLRAHQPRRLLEAEADDFDLAAPVRQFDERSASAGAPRVLRHRASNSGSLFHEGVWPPPGGRVEDPLLTSSQVDLSNIVTTVMGPAPPSSPDSPTNPNHSRASGRSDSPTSMYSMGVQSQRDSSGGGSWHSRAGSGSNVPLLAGYGSIGTARSSSPLARHPPTVMIPNPAAVAKAREASASSTGLVHGPSPLAIATAPTTTNTRSLSAPLSSATSSTSATATSQPLPPGAAAPRVLIGGSNHNHLSESPSEAPYSPAPRISMGPLIDFAPTATPASPSAPSSMSSAMLQEVLSAGRNATTPMDEIPPPYGTLGRDTAGSG